MSNLIEQITHVFKLEAIDNNPDFAFIQRKFAVKPSAVIIALIVFLLIVTLISNATSLVVAIGCCCVPGYFTFVALERHHQPTLHKYLTYWIIYAILEVIAPLFQLILTPTLYILLRLGTTVALTHPESPLAQKIFTDFIKPFFDRHENVIDKNFENAAQKGKEALQLGIKKFI